ncbi:MAG: atoS [Betaproteobacteria bacterium]|nr:atoS [Betaproteobacteria bacterium]
MANSFDPSQYVLATGEAIVAADAKGAIVFWNAAAARIFGQTEAEALGQSLDLIIPERLRERHWQGYDKTMSTGKTRYGDDVLRVPAIRKDGSALSIAFTVTLLRAADNSWTIVATIRDETTRWKEERALKQRIAELEAKSQQ